MKSSGLFFFTLLLVCSSLAVAQVPAERPNLDLWDHGAVFATEIDRDGHLLVAGIYSLAAGQPRDNLARLLLPDAILDETFAPVIDGPVFGVFEQPDGRILIGGLFSQIDGEPRSNLARLNADGSLDESFGPGADGAVYTFALDGEHVVIGGLFSELGGSPRNGLARVALADGTVDANWNPNVTGGARFNGVIALIGDGEEFWIGGNFTEVGGQPSRSLARLDADGQLLTGFEVIGIVEDLSFDSQGRLFVCGPFSHVDGQPRSRLARVDADAILDTFSIDVGQDIHNCQSSGTDVLLSGQFTDINGTALSGAARLNAAGDVDMNFRPQIDGVFTGTPDSDVLAWTIRELPDERVFVGGVFRQVNGQSAVGGAVLSDGAEPVDAVFNVERTAEVRSITAMDDGSVIIGGRFWRSGTEPRDNLAKLLPDGTLDPDWILSANGEILSTALMANGDLVIGGFFSRVAGQNRANLARAEMGEDVPALNSDWTVGTNGAVLVIQPDQLDSEGLYVGGAFTEILIDQQSFPRGRLARLSLNGAGTPDAFNPAFALVGFDDRPQVNDLLQLPSQERLYVGGVFNRAAGQNRLGLAAFTNAAGAPQVDTAFNAGANDVVWALQAAADAESFYVGGFFTSLFGEPRGGLAKIGPAQELSPWTAAVSGGTAIAMAPDGEGGLFVGGNFATLQSEGPARLGRLDAQTGALDPDFNAAIGPGIVWDLHTRTGRLLVAGSFETVGTQARSGLVGFDLVLPDLLFFDRFEQALDSGNDGVQARRTSESETPQRLRAECVTELMQGGRGGHTADYLRVPGCR